MEELPKNINFQNEKSVYKLSIFMLNLYKYTAYIIYVFKYRLELFINN